MARPSACEVIFISVNHSITFMGKVWLIVMIFLRILMILFAGFPLYQDEQEHFVCNTIQPGCVSVCFDLFTPVSLTRFWLVQVIILCLSYIIFIIYVVHTLSDALTENLNTSGHIRAVPLFKIYQEPFRKTTMNKMSLVAEQQGGGCAQSFTGAYILHVMFRTLLEAGFGAAHYYLFGFYIPKRFLCQNPLCTTQVDCYISRPTEKTVMLNFMLGVAALSLLINMFDFTSAIKRSVRQKRKIKMMVAKIYEEEQFFHPTAEISRETEINTSLAQQDLQGEAVQPGSSQKRRGSSGSCSRGLFGLSHESPHLETSLLPGSQGPPGCNSCGNNSYSVSQEVAPEGNGSQTALCPPEPLATPRYICVNKRSRLKPPPPPRRDFGLPFAVSAGPAGDVSTSTTFCTRRLGQRILAGPGSGTELQTNDDGLEKRSEWV
ncbi:gap junction delta-4 protein [Mastacembelus armatus]|uniref:gap junction delta-4 protein n=1 Tax=Mastacembelus armatus TaxID=205130 RepID=UPI000E461F6E|nr:gap junction delta-4 protein [Mastacembelus armatus]